MSREFLGLTFLGISLWVAMDVDWSNLASHQSLFNLVLAIITSIGGIINYFNKRGWFYLMSLPSILLFAAHASFPVAIALALICLPIFFRKDLLVLTSLFGISLIMAFSMDLLGSSLVLMSSVLQRIRF